MIERRTLLVSGLGAVVAISQGGAYAAVSGGGIALADDKDLDPSFETRFVESFRDALVREDRRLVLDPSLLQGGGPVVIWAQEIELSGSYKTLGGSLALVSRKITVAPGTTITTTGVVGDPDFRPAERAADGRTFSAPGAAGARGGEGRPAGDVFILCQTLEGATLGVDLSGARGGSGQPGGNGFSGTAGGKGGKNCAAGGAGGAGGNAGPGGSGGDGGPGGWLFVQTQTPILDGRIVSQLPGGKGGPGGAHGVPGAGGAGGEGGDEPHEHNDGPHGKEG